jgi:hypothetical protein
VLPGRAAGRIADYVHCSTFLPDAGVSFPTLIDRTRAKPERRCGAGGAPRAPERRRARGGHPSEGSARADEISPKTVEREPFS